MSTLCWNPPSCLTVKTPADAISAALSEGEEEDIMEVVKSTNDKRDYRVIKLPNGLTALLISDHVKSDEDKTENVSVSDVGAGSSSDSELDGEDGADSDTSGENKSAAALCIGIGSFCDPLDIPGFAHFLEHMVFMGSSKYPKENDMDDFLGKHGGESNAWTDCEKTLFHFEIQKKHFHKALDKFSQFFTSPLFMKDSVDREIQAIDSEFQMSITSDSERFNQLLGTTTTLYHPMSKFMCGNKKTLKTDPEANGIDVYGRLRQFYEKYYSSHYMTLAVHSQESLDVLQELVTTMFSGVPYNKLPKPSFQKFQDPFNTKEFKMFYKIIPMEDSHSLQITWALPSLVEHYLVKPLEYLSRLMGHEGAGSILSFLKKKVWALEVASGNSGNGFDHNSTWSAFNVEITLTESGMEHVFDVLTVVFQYIAMLGQNGPQPQIYLEMQQIEECKFRWREQGEAIDYVESLSETMQLFPPKHYLTGKHLLFQFDEEIIKTCTDYLQPCLANIALKSKLFKDQEVCDQEEPWFGTKYCVSEINPDWLKQWKNVEPIAELHLPEPNPFVATDFRLAKKLHKNEYPRKITDNTRLVLWFKQDSKFKVPKGFVYFNLISPVLSESVQNAALMDLFINILLHILNESVYPAALAGYEYSVEGFLTGIVLQMAGFNHKLPVLVKVIVDHIAEFEFTNEMFDAIRNELKRSYYNEMLKPYDYAKLIRFAVLEPKNKPCFDRYKIMEELTGKMLKRFVKKFLTNLFIEGFVMGNFLPEEASDMGDYIQSKLCHEILFEENMPKNLLYQLPQSILCCRVQGINEKDINCSVTNYYQSGPGTLKGCCLNEMLVTRMREPCFDILRTKQQLGYSVFCQSTVTNGILGYTITVESQTSKYSLAFIDEMITEFLQQFQSILDDMTQDEFLNLVDTLITEKQSEDVHMGEEAHRCWDQIHDHFYVFDVLKKEIAILKKLKLRDLTNWFEQYVGSAQRKLSCQVEGASSDMEMETDEDKSKTETQEPKTIPTFLSSNHVTIEYITNIKQIRKKFQVLPYTRIKS